jgi:CubicO group peptidase (beta-lactamase class C family)
MVIIASGMGLTTPPPRKQVALQSVGRHILSRIAFGRIFLALIVVTQILASTPVVWAATPPVTGDVLPGLQGLDEAMLRLMEKWNSPGASLAVAYKGKLILARGYGYTSKSSKEAQPVKPQSRFRFASLSKPLTATAIMLLVEDGKLSLDDHVITLLREDAPKKTKDARVKQITVRYLLEHRGGLASNTYNDPMFAPQPPCPNHLPVYLDRWLDHTPGEKFEYSNIGYCILGRVIEKVTGQAYASFVTQRVLTPISVSSIELGASLKSKPDEVTYYGLGEKTSPYGGFNLEAMAANGGWIGSSVDYLKFLIAIDGQRSPALLKPSTFTEMLAKPDDPELKDKSAYYGNGFNVRALRSGEREFWHNGGLVGTTTVAVRTATGYAWVAFFNVKFNFTEIHRTISEAIRGIKKPPTGDLFDKY